MRRLLIAALAALAILPVSPAAATESGAERAVKRTVNNAYWFDDGIDAFCNTDRRNSYSCSITAYDENGRSHHGNARVRQYGSRYSVRFHMYD